MRTAIRSLAPRAGGWAPLAGIALWALACAVEPTDSGAMKHRPQSIIVVLLDTLRADHLDLYGYDSETAPFLARLGARGAVFERAFSSSTWTAPATASLFTGLYPSRSGVKLGFFAHRNAAADAAGRIGLDRLPASVPTLPERFRELGYRTFGIAANVNIGSELGFDRGFDRFSKMHRASAEELFEQLLRWESEIVSGEPFFLYIHFNDIHGPYRRRAPWYRGTGDERGDIRAAYDSEIRYTDGVIERIVRRFDPAEQGIFVALSDHGEEFWDHGELGHGFTLHYELNRIVWLVHAPEHGVAAARHDANVSIVDVAPTLVELAGGAAPQNGDGLSVLPLLLGDESANRLRRELGTRTVYAHRLNHRDLGQELWAATRGRWKLIEGIEGAELYDLELDTAERVDLARRHPQIVAKLSGSIDALRSAEPVAAETVDISLEPGMIEHLRELGYVEP